MDTEENQEENTYKSSAYIYYLVAATCLGSLFSGYQIGVFNQSYNAVLDIMDIQDEDDRVNFEGLITSLIPLGGVIGAYFSHHILKIYSRKDGLILSDIISIVGCSLQICIFSKYLFILGRFISGLSSGINSSLVSLFIMEVAPIQMRQQVSTFPVFGLNLGTLIAYSTGFALQSNIYSEKQIIYIYGFPIIFCIIRLILLKFFLVVDSPYFFFENGELIEAKRLLGIIYKDEYIDQIYHDYHQVFIEKQKNQETFLSVFNYQNKKRIIIAILMMYFLHFVGVSPIMFYSTKLFNRFTNMNRTLSIYLTVISGVFPIVCSFISGFLSTLYGRKSLLFWGMNGQIFITFTFVLLSYVDINDSYDQTPSWLQGLLIINIIASRSYIASTYAPNSLAYVSDICGDKGISIAFMSYWFFQGVVGFLFPQSLFYIGYPLTFLIFCANSVLGSVFVNRYVKETQGLTRIEIMLLYNPEYEQQINQKLKEMYSLKQSLIYINNIDARQSMMQSVRMEQEMTNIAAFN
ncbi:MFS sugar transporter (macronuclear) [Tetrahymena thermophila SB210]|uniref:MFS sugar transporter n=1 Tax=Tetrahymena thermophila (strain SB210) TaxID=312017 RepID=A4VF23_TETTS|nr:MFS sugar transporter [Tetrahymena thermophila SB210]EDK31223.1 MFS sugar transporter [Tetrahymena thermophila SB210]|eukprot:XP_001470661.1 MFS sugar transporter [Tetrahymena thermophila SB210]